MSTEHDITTRDGRTLRVFEGGDPGGRALISLSGTPGSRLLYGPDLDKARERGVRLLGYDRPGYGGSTRLEGRNVADCAADVRAIADALGITTLGVYGGSGGGPHAAACAALLTGLVPAVGVVASVAPWGAPRLDWLDGMGEDNLEEFGAVLEGPGPGRALLERERTSMIAADPAEMVESMRTLLCDVDAEVVSGELGAHMHAAVSDSLAPGVDGWLDDDLAFVSDWGFGLTQIRTPVLVMHGGQDQFVPVAHGRWLAEAIPGAQARIYDDEGHLSLHENRFDELWDWLLARM